MKPVFGAVVVAASLVLAVAALAQSTSPPTEPPVPANPAAAVPVPSGKRFACLTASPGLKGQERRDQMQLCLMQAQLECLKQAIDQKIVGPQRKEYVKSCVQ